MCDTDIDIVHSSCGILCAVFCRNGNEIYHVACFLRERHKRMGIAVVYIPEIIVF